MAKMVEAGLDFIEGAPITIENQLTLRQPPSAVWDVIIDNENWKTWFTACKQSYTTTEQKTGVGSARFLQVDLFKVTEKIIVWDEHERWGFTIPEANLPIAKSVVELITLRPDGEGTHLDYMFAIELRPWMKPFAKVFEWNMRRIFDRSLPGLQPYLDRVAVTA